MAEYLIQDSTLSAIGKAIREQTGNTDLLTPIQMPEEIKFNLGNFKKLINGTLEEVTHNGVDTIRDYAFYSYAGLTSVNFPNCTNVGDYAFTECVDLTTALLPECTSVGESAFANCDNLSLLYLPECTSIYNKSVFIGCINLNNVALGLESITSTTNPLTSAKTMISILSFPNCTSIGSSTFSGYTNLTSVSFPVCTSVANVNAFTGCSKIENITLGYSSISYGIFPFRNAATSQAIKSISLPNCSQIGYSLDYSYSNGMVNSIYYSNAFYNCYTIENVYIPNCTTILEGAFCELSALTYIDVPKCKEIKGRAFYRCISLSMIDLPECKSIGYTGLYHTNNTSATYASAVGAAFEGCKNLSYVNLPVCEYIDDYTFRKCEKLSCISLPCCSEIKKCAFIECYTLSNIYLPMISLICSQTFESTNILKLTSDELPECGAIEYRAFANCSNLSILDLPKLIRIDSNAFQNCTNLKSVFFNNIIGIGVRAFESCNSLETIVIRGTRIPSLGNYCFSGTKLKSIYVPASRIASYKSDGDWIDYSNKIMSIEGSPYE